MSNTTCQECGKEYNPDTVVMVNPVPEKTCFNCMSTLTDEEIQTQKEMRGLSNPEPEFKE